MRIGRSSSGARPLGLDFMQFLYKTRDRASCHDARAALEKSAVFSSQPPPAAAVYIHVPEVALDMSGSYFR
jgi:hypothetical protein